MPAPYLSLYSAFFAIFVALSAIMQVFKGCEFRVDGRRGGNGRLLVHMSQMKGVWWSAPSAHVANEGVVWWSAPSAHVVNEGIWWSAPSTLVANEGVVWWSAPSAHVANEGIGN